MRFLWVLGLLALVSAAPAVACNIPANAANLAYRLMQEINAERARHGLNELGISRQLMQAAQHHACDGARNNRLSHFGTDGSSFGERIIRAGYHYRSATENVALGFPDPALVLQAWMRSPGHRKNILARGPDELGLGIAQGRDGRMHWVMKSGLR